MFCLDFVFNFCLMLEQSETSRNQITVILHQWVTPTSFFRLLLMSSWEVRIRERDGLISPSPLELWLPTSDLDYMIPPAVPREIQRATRTSRASWRSEGSTGAWGHIRGMTFPHWAELVPSGVSQAGSSYASLLCEFYNLFKCGHWDTQLLKHSL